MPDCLLILERKQSGSKIPDSPEFEYVYWYCMPYEFHKEILANIWRFDWAQKPSKESLDAPIETQRVTFKLMKWDVDKNFAWYIET